MCVITYLSAGQALSLNHRHGSKREDRGRIQNIADLAYGVVILWEKSELTTRRLGHISWAGTSAKTELGDGLMQVPKAGTNVIVIRISVTKTRSRMDIIQ